MEVLPPAFIVGTTIAPIIYTIDKSIVLKAMKSIPYKDTYTKEWKKIRNPVLFLNKPTILISGVYVSTFSTYNYLKINQYSDTEILIGTTLVNMTTGIYKDIHFSKVFGTLKKSISWKRNIMSSSMFMMRDVIVLTSSFILPDKILDSNVLNIEKSNLTSTIMGTTLPIIVQPIIVPFHLMGVSLCAKRSCMQHFNTIRNSFRQTLGIKFVRVVPTFIIGTMGNRWLLDWFSEYK